MPYWHDDIGRSFGALMQETDAFLLGRKTYVTHADAFEPMPARFGPNCRYVPTRSRGASGLASIS